MNSINREILITIEQHKQKLDFEYKQIESVLNEFSKKFENDPVSSMKKAEDIVEWLKEIVIGIKIIEGYIHNFPNAKKPKCGYVSDKIHQIENEPIISKVYDIIIPLSMMLNTVFLLRNI